MLRYQTNKLLLLLMTTFIFVGVGFFNIQTVYAYDADCVAAGISDYMKQVLDNVGTVGSNIRFLTPTFNMSEPQFEDLYSSFLMNAGNVLGRLAGTSGNAYNTNGQTIGYWVNRMINAGGPAGNGEIHLAETGSHPPPPAPLPTDLIATVAGETGRTLTSANLFNAFGTNGAFMDFALTNEQILDVCGTSGCSSIGVNFAGPFNSGMYPRADRCGSGGLCLGYVLGIVSGAGDYQAVVDAAKAGFIPIVRIGSGDCTSSSAGVFNDAATYATFIRKVETEINIQAPGKIVYFIVGPNEPNAEQWASPGCGCTTEEPVTEEEFCKAGPYSLTIRGTIKSDKVYTVGTDPATGETTYTPLEYGQQTNLPTVNNIPVKKALIQVHHSWREKSMDTINDKIEIFRHDYNTGQLNGMFVKSYAYKYSSEEDGTFEIIAKSDCSDVYRSDWRGTGYEQFLSISCPDKPEGKDIGLYSKDNYGMVLNIRDIPETEKDRVINLGDINVSCHYDPEHLYGHYGPDTEEHKYVNLNRDIYMSCTGSQVSTKIETAGISNSHLWNFGLKFYDTYNCDSREEPWCVGPDPGPIIDAIRGLIPFGTESGAKTETRTGIAGRVADLNEWSALINRDLGIKGGFSPTIPKYYRLEEDAQDAGVDTYPNSGEEKPKLYTCRAIRRCGKSIGEAVFPDDNTQTCGGAAFNLASPFGGAVRDSNGQLIPEFSIYIARFLALDKNENTSRDICTNGDNVYKVSDIMPPDGYCGDVDDSGFIDGGEMECPTTWSCGDVDEDCVFEPNQGEVRCEDVVTLNADGSPSNRRYKLDSRYFPYFAMFSPTTVPYGDTVPRRTTTLSDSYANREVKCPRGTSANQDYQPGEGPGGDSKPMNDPGCIYQPSSNTFWAQEEIQIPGYGLDSANLHTQQYLGASDKMYIGLEYPSQNLGTPQTFLSADPIDPGGAVKQSVAGMKGTLSFTNKGNIYKIGTPSNLCSCSLVESTGSTRLGKCLDEDADQAQVMPGAAPNPQEPSNVFNIARDQGDPEWYYPERFNTVYNPDLRASRTAGGADWTWISENNSGQSWVHDGEPTQPDDKHYLQNIDMTASILGSIGEYIFCNPRYHPPQYDPYRPDYWTASCSRDVRHMALNKTYTAWELPPADTTPLVFDEAFYPPKFEDDSVNDVHQIFDAVSLENELMTKAQRTPNATDRFDIPGNQATGQVVHSRNSVSYPNSVDRVANMVAGPAPDIPVGEVAPPPPTPTPTPTPPGGGWQSCPSGCNQLSCSTCDCIHLEVSGACVHNPDTDLWADVRIECVNGVGWGPTNIGGGDTVCPEGCDVVRVVTSRCGGCQGPCNWP